MRGNIGHVLYIEREKESHPPMDRDARLLPSRSNMQLHSSDKGVADKIWFERRARLTTVFHLPALLCTRRRCFSASC